MGRDDERPPIPRAEDLAGVSLPDSLVDPSLDADERAGLLRALRGAEIIDPVEDDPTAPQAEDRALARLGCQAVLAFWVLVGPVTWLIGSAPAALVLIACLLAVVAGVALQRRRRHLRRIKEARRRRHLLIPVQDLDAPAQALLRAAVRAVRDVRTSRSRREDRLADGPALLEDQQWRVASALARLTEARRLVRQAGSRLEEHHRMVRDTESAIEERVRTVLAYAASVRRMDGALADLDAASYTDLLDHHLRESLAALGEDHGLPELTADAEATRVAAVHALQELRQQTGVLRSLHGEEL